MYKIHKSQKARDDPDAVDVAVRGVLHPTDVVIFHRLQQPQGWKLSSRLSFVNSYQTRIMCQSYDDMLFCHLPVPF